MRNYKSHARITGKVTRMLENVQSVSFLMEFKITAGEIMHAFGVYEMGETTKDKIFEITVNGKLDKGIDGALLVLSRRLFAWFLDINGCCWSSLFLFHIHLCACRFV